MSDLKWISVIEGQAEDNVIYGFVVESEKSPIFYQQGPNDGTKSSILKFTLSRQEQYKDKEGNWKDVGATQWYNVVAFGKHADSIYPVIKAAMASGGIKLRIPFMYDNKRWEKDGKSGYTQSFIVCGFVNVLWCKQGIQSLVQEHDLKFFPRVEDKSGDTAGF